MTPTRTFSHTNTSTTGSGKTLIAALLLQHVCDQELEDRAQGLPARISFFLVDKVALVFQQHAVLECNLGHAVEKFCGDMVQHNWNRDFWKEQFEKNMVIVCTAEILCKCLQHAYIRIDQINLLIFDEAHHTKKNHPYARIIKDYYADEEHPGPRLPRIFGMTASPVDAQVDVKLAAAELEGLLHSQIATASDPTVLQRTVSRPKEEKLVTYSRMPEPFDTELTAKLKRLVGQNNMFKKAFSFAKDASSQLGPWCVDRMWQIYLLDQEIMKLEARAHRGFANQLAAVATIDAEKDALKRAKQVVEQHPLSLVRADDPQLLSDKVIMLLGVLREQFSTGENTEMRCIVFVNQRWTAVMLADLLQRREMNMPYLKVATLIGTGNSDDAYSNTSFKQQILTIIKFKKGELNCIFATSVAEEGLDIPDCNLIVRFDLYKTMIQYIQSRGRARQAKSVYIHMVEEGNAEHRRRMHQNTRNEQVLRQFCSAVPEDRKLTGNDLNMDYYLRKETNLKGYTVPSTGARLTYKRSLGVLAEFTSSLQHIEGISEDSKLANLTPDFVVTAAPGGFVCEIKMPHLSPIRSIMGDVHSTKQVAKCSAAFKMCYKLLKAEYINDELRPKYAKKLHVMRNALLAVSEKKKHEYSFKVKPHTWDDVGVPESLYGMVMVLSTPEYADRPSRPLLMLTRKPLPHLKPFRLYFGKDRSSEIKCVPFSTSVQLKEGDLKLFTNFTLTVFDNIFSKEYEATEADLPYFLVPACETHRFDFHNVVDARDVMDWELMRDISKKSGGTMSYLRYKQATEQRRLQGQQSLDLYPEYEQVQDDWKIDYKNKADDFFTDKYVLDPWDGGCKYFLRGLRKDLNPLSPIPDGTVHVRNKRFRDVLNYSVNIYGAARVGFEDRYDKTQPVVEAEVVSLRRNLLDEKSFETEVSDHTCFLILETLCISPLPTDVVAMAYNVPAIVYRLEQNLVALEACQMLGLNIDADLALQAFTKDSDNQGGDPEVGHTADLEILNFQGGMGENYERLEFLGDAFLKMATTISIFTLIPHKDEFQYHVERMLLICNQNLFNNALEVNLPEYIRSKSFNRAAWYPEGLNMVARGKKRVVKDSNHLEDGGEPENNKPSKSEETRPVGESKKDDNPKSNGNPKDNEETAAERKEGPKDNEETAAKRKRGGKKSLVVREAARRKHGLADKSIADVCEAIIGAAYMTTHKNNDFTMAIQAVTKMVNHKHHRMMKWEDYYAAYVKPDWQVVPANAAEREMALKIKEITGYDFKYPRLLRSAFRHPSMPAAYEKLPSYQRMEFLGDALFDMVSIDYLFHLAPDKGPQWLTEHKMAMVSNQFLGCLAVELGFNKYMVSWHAELQKQVLEYVTEITDARIRAEDEAEAQGKDRSQYRRDYWVEAKQPPKCLPDIVEAYIGAIFVDSEYDYGKVVAFFNRHVKPYFTDLKIYDTFANKHPVTFCCSFIYKTFGCHAYGLQCQEVPVMDDVGLVTGQTRVLAGIMVHGQVVDAHLADSGRYAKVGAARKAMVVLENMSRDDFLVKYRCTCKPVDVAPDISEEATAI